MESDIQHFYSPDDNCVYFYDKKKGQYRKICDIPSFKDLPIGVQRQIKAAKEEALETMQLPSE
jgi:hypothetical protein